ncbi:dihydrofolate reductase [Aliicoccus persicus]|uniref:Dihydrofolate reductase n=1 Tax=Aliicoccus persicus TaxID=930138 RepID=A0A662Z285_9STAP|nr:dihydrofolate reductase [Aliicoccus persicus]SEV83203.1 dihydrofolate reductase [Aliicoccus persicus]HJE19674.1 dihydrofolate reductase [Aliicoccus persicus]
MVSLIVAHAKQNVIGFKNKMPWHLPNDLKHVKALTTGQTIVMGRKTYDSLGRALPNRTNVVLSRNTDLEYSDATVIHSVEDIKNLPGKVFIFGGANIYRETRDIVDEMFITSIEEVFAGDTFFPEYDLEEWTVISREKGEVDQKNIYPHEYLHLKRK